MCNTFPSQIITHSTTICSFNKISACQTENQPFCAIYEMEASQDIQSHKVQQFVPSIKNLCMSVWNQPTCATKPTPAFQLFLAIYLTACNHLCHSNLHWIWIDTENCWKIKTSKVDRGIWSKAKLLRRTQSNPSRTKILKIQKESSAPMLTDTDLWLIKAYANL